MQLLHLPCIYFYYTTLSFILISTYQKISQNTGWQNPDVILIKGCATMRWKKLITNIDVSGLSVVLNASLHQLIKNPSSFKLLCDITQEIIFAAEKCGAKLPKDIYAFRLNILEKFKSLDDSDTSMKLDFDLKKPLELHAIYENTIQTAKQNQVQLPLTEMLYHQLLYLDENNRKC